MCVLTTPLKLLTDTHSGEKRGAEVGVFGVVVGGSWSGVGVGAGVRRGTKAEPGLFLGTSHMQFKDFTQMSIRMRLGICVMIQLKGVCA